MDVTYNSREITRFFQIGVPINLTLRPERFQTILFSSIGLVFMFMPILFYAANSRISLIGSLLLIVVYLVAVRDTLSRPVLFDLHSRSLLFLFLASWCLIAFLLNFQVSSLYNLFLCVGGLYMMLFFSEQAPSAMTMRVLFWASLAGLMILIPLGIHMGNNGGISAYNGFRPYFNQVVFKMMLPLSFFVIRKLRFKWLYWTILILVYYHMIERTSAVITAVVMIAYYLLPLFNRHRKLLKTLFFVLIIFLLLFDVFYVWLFQTELGLSLNQQVRAQTNKNLFSGRQNLWLVSWEAFIERPITGYGFEPGIIESRGYDNSTHNAYIYMLLHSGLAGLVLFVGYLYSFWRLLIERWGRPAHLAMAYLIAFLIYMNFELTLVANSMVLGLYYTLAISLGVALSIPTWQTQGVKNESC